MADDIKLNADPESTWGASDEYKTAWHEKYGNVSPAASASKADWVKFATGTGMSESAAEGMTRDELVEHFGGSGQVYSAPAVANDNLGGGDGAGPATTGAPTTGTSTGPSTGASSR